MFEENNKRDILKLYECLRSAENISLEECFRDIQKVLENDKNISKETSDKIKAVISDFKASQLVRKDMLKYYHLAVKALADELVDNWAVVCSCKADLEIN